MSGVPSDWSVIRSFTTGSAELRLAGPLLLSSPDTYAFVEVVGPGGADPCGPTAVSTFGCLEVGGNYLYPSFNGTGVYIMYRQGGGTEDVIGNYAPHDYEIRFTAGGSYAYFSFSTGAAIWVPFEIWDIGPVGPFGVNDPSDDVRMIPNLFSDNNGECAFEYGELSDATGDAVFGRPATDRVYAFYPATTYDAWASAIGPIVNADPNGCPASPETDPTIDLIDFDRGRALQRVIFVDNVDANGDGIYDGTISNIQGAVVRFYTTDYAHSPPAPSAPADGAVAVPGDTQLFWSGIGAPGDDYQVQVSTDPSFQTNIVFDGSTSAFTIQVNPSLAPETLYYWRVRGRTDAQTDWSAVWSFTATDAQGFDCDAVTQIPVLECEALVALYNNANGPNWTNNTGWLQTNTPCSWDSITCEAGGVSRLIKLYSNLDGTLPAELGNLAGLKELRIEGNFLRSALPPELGNLSNLEKLVLADNGHTGPIPPELGNLFSLQELNFFKNGLTGAIPSSLGNLPNLSRLDLSVNLLEGPIPETLGNISPALFLNLADNQLAGTVPLSVAALNPVFGCLFTGNPDLCMPDTPPYQALGNPLCGLTLGGPNCPVRINTTAFLHGPYTSTQSMRTDLAGLADFPLAQPFNTPPWDYAGTETLTSVPPDIVDWVLLTLREFKTVPNSVVGRRAAFLRSDGKIVDLDGTSPVEFFGVADGLYYLWIQHRTHLGIMTASQLNVKYDTDAYSFTTGQDRALGNLPMVELESGVFGLWGGDGNASGDVTASDFLSIWLPDNGNAGYLAADFNMDGQVTAFDFLTVWLVSNGQASQVPN